MRTMSLFVLGHILLAAAAAAPLAPVLAAPPHLPLLEWVKFTFHAGHVCEGSASTPARDTEGFGSCRSYAHTVIMVGPHDVTDHVVGGATYRLTGPHGSSAPIEGGPATFERHLVESDGNATKGPTLPEGTRAQMWNWGYDAFHRRATSADPRTELPGEISHRR